MICVCIYLPAVLNAQMTNTLNPNQCQIFGNRNLCFKRSTDLHENWIIIEILAFYVYLLAIAILLGLKAIKSFIRNHKEPSDVNKHFTDQLDYLVNVVNWYSINLIVIILPITLFQIDIYRFV